MVESPFRLLTRVVLGICLAGSAMAQSGWSTSDVVSLARPAYSVYGPTPPCSGRVLVDESVRGLFDALGRAGVDPDAPSRASRAVGDALNLFGLDAVLQDYATCADVCARIPVAATRVTHLIAYIDDGAGMPFRTVPFDSWIDYVHWEPGVDTTRVDDGGRLVCVRVRHWLDIERRVFMVVGYER